jgi:hypothetical protein
MASPQVSRPPVTGHPSPAAPLPDRGAFAIGARAGFEAARRAAGGDLDFAFRLANRVLLLRFAGPALVAPLTRGLALDRVAAETPADLSVGAWDGETTRVGPPACPFGAGDFLVRGDVRHPWGGGVHLSYAVTSGTLEYADLDERVGCFWIRRAGVLEPWRAAAPLRGLLATLAEGAGGCLAHAAAVGREGEGLLLTGPGGSGKSTTALAAAARGWSFCGDDFVMVRSDGGGTRVVSLYSTAKLTSAGARAAGLTRDRFTTIEGSTDEAGKSVYQVPTSAGLRLCALVVPSVAGRDRRPHARTLLRPASRAEAVRALLPSSLLLLPGRAAAARTRLAALATGLPSFVLELGPDPDENVGGLARALDGARRPAR